MSTNINGQRRIPIINGASSDDHPKAASIKGNTTTALSAISMPPMAQNVKNSDVRLSHTMPRFSSSS